MARETIKSHVVQTARQDPFLSIDEIATIVQTTPRYVRTILSEAQISLMQLRKSYAKTMEKQLTPVHKVSDSFDPQLKLTKVIDGVMAQLLAVDPQQELLQLERMQTINDVPCYVQFVTYADLSLGTIEGSLRQLLPRDKGALVQKSLWVEVVTNQPNLSRLLTSSTEQPLLKLCYLLSNDEVPLAVETQWFPTEGICLKTNSSALEITAQFGW